jgi:hypothetical protein
MRAGNRLGIPPTAALAGLGALLGLCAFLAAPASALEKRLPQPPLGSFAEPKGLAFDQGADQLYVIDGRSEKQKVTVTATAGKFRLKLGAAETGELDFNADREQVRDALRAAICPGKECVLTPTGQGGPVPIPYEIVFDESLATTEVEQLTCLPGTLSGGSGCSVTTTSDGVNGTITRYNADGSAANFSALGSNAIDGRGGADKVEPPLEGLRFTTPFAVQVAVDESGGATDGDIYVTQSFDHLVDVFSSSGEFKGQLSEYKDGVFKPLSFVCGVAVDNGGDVYVADASSGIHKYDPAGNPVTNADSVANFTGVEGPCNLAAGAGSGKELTAGSLFAVRVTEGELFKLDTNGGAVKYPVSERNTTVTVDPTSGHVLAAAGGEVKEFDASGASEAIQIGSIAAGSTVSGVAVDGAPGKGGTVYLSRSGVPHLDVYGPFVKVPLVEAQAPSPIGGTTATLRGTVSADGGPGASCHFEYLAEATYLAQKKAAEEAGGKTNDQIADAAFAGAGSVPCEPPGPFTGSGSNAVAGEAEELTAETKYEFRLLGENENGVIASSPLGFETFGKPVVEGGKASQVTATTALISGAVNPRGTETEAAVQYVTKEQFEATKFEAATIAPLPNLPAEVSGSGDLSAATGVGSLTKGLSQVSGLSVTSGTFVIGQTIEGAGIPNGTTLTNANPGGGTLTLSQPASQTIAGTALSAGSKTITNLSTAAGRFAPGQVISGPGIPQATTILSAQAGRLVLSKALTEEVSGAALTATGPQPVSVELTGLSPDTAYVFRLVAQSVTGEKAEPQGKAAGFTTFVLPGPPLPDHRAYEMVTPAQKTGEPYVPESEPRGGLGGTCRHCTPGFERERMPMQSNADGGAIAFEGDPFEAGLAPAGNEYLSRRGEGGWQTAGLSKPNYRDDDNSGTGFKALSADLTRAVLLQVEPALSPQAPEGFANLYLREVGNEALQTAITAPPPHRTPGIGGPEVFRVNYAGANAGSGAAEPFSHVIFQANDALSGEDPGIAPEAPEVGPEERDLYEWSGGQLHLVNVLPGNGVAAPNAVIGSGLLLALGLGAENFDFDHAISDDGQRIFWSTVPSGQVYVREGGTSTLEIPDPGKFLTASPDGAKVLLSDGVLYDLEDETPTDLSAGQGGFQGIAGASEDLSRIYFIDTKVLAPGAEEGQPNLYLWEEGEIPHEGTTSFIATLLASDNLAGVSGGIGTWHAGAGNRLAQASRDGRFLAFASRAPLTGYDSTLRDLSAGFEVFEYDAQSQTLSCPSCNPSGEGPLGSSNLALFFSGGGEFFAPLQNLAPEGEGRLFFESRDALVQADANGGIQDVYEWEPAGVGDCVRPGGCVALISNGRSPKDSHFIAADGDGSDVFFTTRERLVPRDKDDFLDIYDARVGGGFDEGESAPCAGEACKGQPSSPPLFEAPASSRGKGEEAPRRGTCKRGFVRRGAKCARRHRAAKQKHRRHRAAQKGGAR